MPHRYAVDFAEVPPPVRPGEVQYGTWEGPSTPLAPAESSSINPGDETGTNDEKPVQPPAK